MNHNDPVDQLADLHGATANDLGAILDVEAGLREALVAAEHSLTDRDLPLAIEAGLNAILPTTTRASVLNGHCDVRSSVMVMSAPFDAAPANKTIKHSKRRQRMRKTAIGAAGVLLTILGFVAGVGTAQAARPLPPRNEPAPEAAIPAPFAGPWVSLQWQENELAVSWTDPSGGSARPVLLGNVKDGAPILSALAKGDTRAIITQAIVPGLSPAATYCLTVALVKWDSSVLLSHLVCTERPHARRVDRFEALSD